MNEIEQYEFDRQGFLVIKNLLPQETAAELLAVVDLLERHAVERIPLPPRKKSIWGQEYHRNEEQGYHAIGTNGPGGTIVIEDFLMRTQFLMCL